MNENIGVTVAQFTSNSRIRGWVTIAMNFLYISKEDGKPRNFSNSSWEVSQVGWYFTDLDVWSGIDVEALSNKGIALTPEQLTRTDIEYDVSGHVGYEKLKAMTSTINRIQNKLKKLDNEVGWANYYFETAVRVARTVGVKHFIELAGYDYRDYTKNSYLYYQPTTHDAWRIVNNLLRPYVEIWSKDRVR